jgi:hypothetical protein
MMMKPIINPIKMMPPIEPPTAAPMIVPVLELWLGIGVGDKVFVTRGVLRVEELEDMGLGDMAMRDMELEDV